MEHSWCISTKLTGLRQSWVSLTCFLALDLAADSLFLIILWFLLSPVELSSVSGTTLFLPLAFGWCKIEFCLNGLSKKWSSGTEFKFSIVVAETGEAAAAAAAGEDSLAKGLAKKSCKIIPPKLAAWWLWSWRWWWSLE